MDAFDYDLEQRTWLPHYGDGVYTVLLDGNIGEVVLELMELRYLPDEPYGTLVGRGRVEGIEVYLLISDRDLVWKLAPLRFRLPLRVHIWREGPLELFKVEVI